MQYITLASIVSLAAYALAANPNAFTSPTDTDVLYAGSDFILEWDSTDGGDEVDLILVSGPSNNLKNVLTIAKSLSNEGAVRWAVPTSVESGNYSIEIINDSSSDEINYSPSFQIVNNGTASSDSESSTSAADNSTAAATTADVTSGLNSTTTDATVVPTGGSINASTTAGNLSTSGEITSGGASHTTKHSGSATGSASGSAAESGSASSSSSKAGAAATGLGPVLLGAGIGAAAMFAL